MSLVHRLAVALVIGLLVVSPRLAAADDSHPYGPEPLTQKEKLRWNVLLQDGKNLANEERWGEASAKFTEVIKLEPHPDAFLWKGYAEEKLGHLLIAKAMYAEAWNLSRSDEFRSYAKKSEGALAQLTKKIPLIVLHVLDDVHARVSVDGALIASQPEGIGVNPGMRTVSVFAPGREPFRVQVKAEEGQVYRFEVPLPLSPPDPPTPPVEGPRGCGACSVGSPSKPLLPGMVAALAVGLLGVRRRQRRRG